MQAVFITGTDTGVGKTVVSGLLGRYLNENGILTITQKWIQAGVGEYPPDIECHLKLMGRKKEDCSQYLDDMMPYAFSLAASPHLAAAAENKSIRRALIKRSFRTLSEKFDTVVVEGIGGVLVPYNQRSLVIEIAQELRLSVIIVAQNKLGAINHTLLTIEALRKRRMKIIGIIFNDAPQKEAAVVREDNPKIIEAVSGVKILGHLPWSKSNKRLHDAFSPIGDKILADSFLRKT